MSTIKVLYCRNRHFSTPILRTVMWSPWSHCGVIMPDEVTLIDATFYHDVSRRSLAAVLADASKYEIRDVQCPDPAAAYAFLAAQLGKPYDTLGVLGIGLHRNWQRGGAWFCSELVEAALAAGGNPRFGPYAGRVTPQHSWMVCPDLLTVRPAVH